MNLPPPARILWTKKGDVVKDQQWYIHSYDATVNLSMATKDIKITEQMKEAGRLLAETAITAKQFDCSFDVDGKKVTCIARVTITPRRDKDEGK